MHITMRDGSAIVLDYLPQDAPLADHVQSRIERYERDRRRPPADGPTEGEESGGDDDHDESLGGRDR